jgi:twitching motility protein PilT
VKLLDSLLDAIVRLEGDALVMHVGEKPYVVTASSSMNAYRGPLAWGQVELSSRVLTFDAVSSMLGQILPADQQVALTEFGAIEHEIPSPAGVADRFTVIAARGGEDVWVELRRRPIEIPQAPASEGVPQESAPVAAEPAAVASSSDAVAVPVAPAAESPSEPVVEAVAEMEFHGPELELVTDAGDRTDGHPAADVHLETHESIVVAIPGQAAEEFALNAVPDNAIQIIDDEPQGVPTEEEVDAMLGATAAALLTSGLSGEVVADDDVRPPVGMESDDVEAQEEETEIVLPRGAAVFVAPVSEVVADVELEITGPAWELSAPPEAGVEQLPSQDVEPIAEAPIGTPLFSEEAMLAAAPPSWVSAQASSAFEAPAVEQPPAADATAIVEFTPVVEQPPIAEVAPVVEFTPVIEQVSTAEVAPVVEFKPVIEQSQPVKSAPAVTQLAPIVEHVEHVEHAEHEQVAEVVPVVEFSPAFEAPSVDYQSVVGPTPVPVYTPVVEVPPVVGYTPTIEPVYVEPAPVVVEFTPAVEPEAIAEMAPLVEYSTVVEPPPLAHDPSVHEITQVVETPSFDEPPVYPSLAQPVAAAFVVPVSVAPESAVEDVQATTGFVFVPAPAAEALVGAVPEPSVEATVAHQETEDQSVNAGAAPVVSEPTPQAWTPSAPERPMEVTPELGRQEEPAAGVTHWGSASPVAPAQETPEPVLHAEADVQPDNETRHSVVVPLARTPIKPEPVSVPFTPSEDAALMHTLRVAAARGASTVYVVAQSKPMIRIDGEIGPLESEPTLTAADVDRLVMELAPPRRRDALQNGPVEWLCDVPEIGRVRCMTFRDHRGPGVLFRMFPPRAISADQLGLTPEVQALCQQSDGLVIVTGARASGKSTLLNAFVDLINRTRSDHVITIESQIGFVHESRRSFISQRESRGDADLAATFARAALREDPDVMMIEDLKSAELVAAALEAAESGRLVVASVPASSTIGALERLIEVFPADRRAKARTSLATALRGVIAQVLLRRVKGGRIAAREILLNTPAVSQLVLEGKMFQLPVALDSGRRHGMVPLTDSLAAHVRDGTVQVAEAYRKALDRAALVALLKREGIDTSFAERLG